MSTRSTSTSTALLAIATLLLVVSICLLGAALWGVSMVRADTDEARATATQYAAQALQLQADANLANRTANDRASLAVLALSPGDDAVFISQIESLATQEGIKLQVSSVNATPPANAETPGTLALSIQVSGSFGALMRFIQLLETEPAALSISGVDLSYDAGSHVWDGTFSVTVLSFDAP